MKLLDLCPDNLIHLPGVTHPETYINLLCKVAGQFKGELQFKDKKIGTKPEEDMFTTWSTLWNGMLSCLKGLARESAQKILSKWKEHLLKGLKSHTVSEAVNMLMACLEDDDVIEQCTYLLEQATELCAHALEKEADWENTFCKMERDRVETKVLAEATHWKTQEQQHLNDEIQAELAQWAIHKLEKCKDIILKETFQNTLAAAQEEQHKKATVMAWG